jgi:formate-dependent nitrite reductase membrane component NrfD
MFELVPPQIAPWGIEVIIYFFLIGTAGMVFVTAAASTVFGPVAAPVSEGFRRTGSIIALALLAVCVALLIADLGQPSRFLNPILYFRWTSPISWGSLLLPLFGLAIVGFLYGLMTDHGTIQRWSAIFGSLLALSMPLYTGVDLMVHQARELWANPSIPVLFVFLSITSGAALVAVVQLAAGRLSDGSARLLQIVLAFSIGITFWLFLGLVMAIVYGSEEMQQAWTVINAEYAIRFWVFSFVIGILLPLVLLFGPMLLPAMKFAESPAVVTLAAVFGAVGAYTLREVLVYAGQIPQLYY